MIVLLLQVLLALALYALLSRRRQSSPPKPSPTPPPAACATLTPTHRDAHEAATATTADTAASATATTITTTTTATTTTRANDMTSTLPEVLIAYASHSQNAYALAHRLFSLLSLSLSPSLSQQHDSCRSNVDDGAMASALPRVRVVELREGARDSLGVEDLLEQRSRRYALVVFVVSTYTDGAAPPRSQSFELLLRDAYEDHRVPRNALQHTRFALFGLGDRAYGVTHFNAFAKHLHTWCRGLGAPPFVVPPVYATEAKAQMLFGVFVAALQQWLARATFAADGTVHTRRRTRVAVRRDNDDNNKRHVDNDDDDDDETATTTATTTTTTTRAVAQDDKASCSSCHGSDHDDDDDDRASAAAAGDDDDVDDVEDVVWDGQDDDDDNNGNKDALPELLYPRLRDNLRKQGYRLVGTHSAVKLCRWTKSMLRGRGGCYKHTFYNISSAQCMEATPSLACANKCVFCWRHHTNPVARSFRWRQDAPELIVAQCLAEHAAMVRQMRGVPGVTPERLRDAARVRHCALSLVGEPIMYPQINALCDLLHAQRISTFLVTNAQFPQQLRQLRPVVQLYLSIDAPTPAELKRIDRPLFEDYWERCVACVQALRAKRQRTVFRLTLVNQYNGDNVGAYADMVHMGWPDLIEVKGVTYCGTSNGSTLTMREHVPRHDEVVAFCEALCAAIAQRSTPHASTSNNNDNDNDDNNNDATWPYRIACEHEHSCCVLIARDTFYYDGCWHTWIDYDKFFALVQSGRDDFDALAYAAPTPSWTAYRSRERGFDPAQSRVVRRGPRPTAPCTSATVSNSDK